jgi:hypothetical protein
VRRCGVFGSIECQVIYAAIVISSASKHAECTDMGSEKQLQLFSEAFFGPLETEFVLCSGPFFDGFSRLLKVLAYSSCRYIQLT